MHPYKHFEVQPFDGVSIVLIHEPRLLRQELLDSLRDEMLRFVEEERPQKLLMFYGEVEYCTSAAISGLLSVKRRIGEYGGQIKLCELSDAVLESFRRLGLANTVFEIYSSVGDAMEAFGVAE
jgi:anti-sigma B factor antagonist